MSIDYEISSPKPCALVESLRSVGYTLPTAIADILDNSITAKAQNIWIQFHWSGSQSRVTILDDGTGMEEAELAEAMCPGSANPLDIRDEGDLGRFGLGLKTASFSQCRKLTVWSKSSATNLTGRCWDLDYVAKHNEWRLKKALSPEKLDAFDKLQTLRSGTLISWEQLDRVVDSTSASSLEAQNHFLKLIDEVNAHLAMIFHRFLSGTKERNPIQIFLNGSRRENAIRPWNPFAIEGSPASKETPVERIALGKLSVLVKGFVLPHKDRLTDDQYRLGAGPQGWLSQQGYYIYRNDRILLAGDWLKLGRDRLWTKEEQYKLARLSIDIPNAMDHDWSLDIKKSTAKPPAAIKERLTNLADDVRADARRVFAHRGEYGPRPSAPNVLIERPWKVSKRASRIVYLINRKHPLLEQTLRRLGPLATELNPMLRLIEETVPVQKIWLDTAEPSNDHAIPYEGYDDKTIKGDIKKVCDFLSESIKGSDNLRAYLLATEPFNRYQVLVEQVIGER